MSHFRWQFYPSLSLSYRTIPDDFGPTVHYLIIGPFQCRWWT